MKRVAQVLTQLTQQKDILLIVVFMLILLMIILPLPPFLMDVLITINLSASIIIMLMTLQLHRAVQFSTFPSLLLVTTLFRLAISISTTRLILLEGNAGAIVETFGEVVVGGNLVVGLVIFMIITVVQFLVITKGADRVAEVGARFTLDAMPGKQMGVDADVRAGNMSQFDAKIARDDLERESKLFGAMDGAMKFVKGDSIAGLVITAINLIGGIAIGMAQLGYSFGDALQLYALMTVGDGLVAQIPALLISISAGVMVTRVTSPNGTDLGTEIGEQLTSNHRTVLLASGAIALFGFIPGFPTVIFLILAAIMAGGIIMLTRRIKQRQEQSMQDWDILRERNDEQAMIQQQTTGISASVTLVMPPFMIKTDPFNFYALFAQLKGTIESDYIVPTGQWYFEFGPEGSDEYIVKIDEDVVRRVRLEEGKYFVKANVSYLESLDIPCIAHFGFREGALVDVEHALKLSEEGVKVFSDHELMMYDLSQTIINNVHLFAGPQAMATILGRLAGTHPVLAGGVQEALSNAQISKIIRFFLHERMKIVSPPRVFEAIMEWGPKQPDPFEVLQHVRLAVSESITDRYAPESFLRAVIISPSLESILREGFRAADEQRFLVVSNDVVQYIVSNVRQIIGDSYNRERHPVLLAQQDVRRALFNILKENGVFMPVLAYQELLPETVIYPVGFIAPTQASV